VEVGEVGTALAVAGHPGVRDQALGHAALDIKAVAADAVHGDVVDAEIVDSAVVAGGDDLDAIAFLAVALDDEVGEGQVAQVNAGIDHHLDDRRAVGDLDTIVPPPRSRPSGPVVVAVTWITTVWETVKVCPEPWAT